MKPHRTCAPSVSSDIGVEETLRISSMAGSICSSGRVGKVDPIEVDPALVQALNDVGR